MPMNDAAPPKFDAREMAQELYAMNRLLVNALVECELAAQRDEQRLTERERMTATAHTQQ